MSYVGVGIVFTFIIKLIGWPMQRWASHGLKRDEVVLGIPHVLCSCLVTVCHVSSGLSLEVLPSGFSYITTVILMKDLLISYSVTTL